MIFFTEVFMNALASIMISVKMFYLYLIIISFGLPAVWETWVRSLSLEVPLEKRIATHSRFLA